jgi:hypothetical protein
MDFIAYPTSRFTDVVKVRYERLFLMHIYVQNVPSKKGG